MTFYLISGKKKDGGDSVIPRAVEDACAAAGIECVTLYAETATMGDLPTPTATDMVYRSALSSRAHLIEKLMLNTECAHIYTDLFSGLSDSGGSFFHHRRTSVPVIPTIPFIPDTADEIERAAEELGGFPIVVKVMGGSRGVGVIRVDSLLGLRSLLDHLRDVDAPVYLRKYIDHRFYVRAAVVGREVVASYKAYTVEGEFRTNAGDDSTQRRESVVLPLPIQRMTVEAVALLRVEFAGVDILFDEKDEPYVAEVNSPFAFVHTQNVTGVDIAAKLVDHLRSKTER